MAVRKDSVQITVDIETQQGVKAYQKLLDETKQVNAEMRKLKRSGQENSEEFKKLQARSAKLNNELNKLGGAGANMGQLIARSRDLNRELRSLVPGTQRFIDVTKELKTVNSRLADIRKETKGVAEGMQEVSILGVKLPPAFQKMAKGVNTVQTAFKAFIALEVIRFFLDLFRVVDDTTQQFIKLRGAIQQDTGSTGDTLDSYTTRVAAIGTTFEKETDTIREAANALTKQLTGDFATSLDLIEKGFLAGADRGGDFLDQVKEYPAFFREAGLTGEQMISVISQSVQEGVFSDKGVDLIKEFNLRIRELPKSTVEALNAIGLTSKQIRAEINENGVGGAFRLVQERLNKLKDDSPAVGQALADIFGGPGEDAGIQFIKTLQLTDESLQKLIDTGGEYTAQLQAQLEADQELAEAQNRVSKGFADSSNSLRIYTTRVKTFLFNVAGEVLKFFENLPATIAGFKAAVKQDFENLKLEFQSLVLSLKIAGKQISKLNPFGKTNEQLNAEIAELRNKKSAIDASVGSVLKAYNEAYKDEKKQTRIRQSIAEAMIPKPDDNIVKQRAKETVAALRKATEEEAKKPAKLAPVAAIGGIAAPQSIQSTGSAEIDTTAQENILKNKFLKALLTEQQYEEERFRLQQEAYNKRLEFLKGKFGEESAAYVDLENQKLEAQKTYEEQRRELTKRTEEARQAIQQQGLSALGDLVDGTIQLLGDEEGARKKNSIALKAFTVGKILIDTQEAIMAIIKNAQSSPANILFPGAGNIIQGLKIAGVLAKSGAALNKVRSTGFYEGGYTGNNGLFRDNNGREVVGGVHKNEWVAPEWQVRHPVAGQMIQWLENMRQRGFQDGGFSSAAATSVLPTSSSGSFAGLNSQAIEQAIKEMTLSQRELATVVKQKQFNVRSGQIVDALEVEYRLDEKSGF